MNTVAIAAVVLLIVFSEQIVAGLKSAYAFVAARMPSVSGGFSGIFQAKIEIKAWKALALVALLFLARGGVTLPEWKWPTDWNFPTWTIGSKPLFPTDKLSVLIVEETIERGRYTASQLDAILSTDGTSPKAIIEAKGGRFEVIDKDAADKLAASDAWVKAAFAVKRDSLPWVVGSTPKRGFSAPLTSDADLRKRVEGL